MSQAERIKSRCRLLDLDEQIAPQPGNFTSFGIISPVLSIERKGNDIYISSNFLLQANITGFSEQ